MGTNYYWTCETKPACEHCGRQADVEQLHIGKSSGGWCFSLHVDPERGINDLPDWERLWATPGSRITNEYGDTITPEAMLTCITERYHHEGLRRHIDQTSSPGAGTWDLIIGEFS